MSLPVNATPVYSLTIPSTKKEFKYRPFLVKEEKALLIAQQSNDVATLLNTIKEVIKSCAKSDVDVDDLASFDVEYMFLQLRASSVGEMVELQFPCDDCGDVPEALATTYINLQEAAVEFPEGHSKKIPLFGDVGVVMKYPTYNVASILASADTPEGSSPLQRMEQVEASILSCIDYVYDADEVHHASDSKPADLIEFINNLTSEQAGRLKSFIDNLPRLRVYVNYDCPKCKKAHTKYMEGLTSFF